MADIVTLHICYDVDYIHDDINFLWGHFVGVNSSVIMNDNSWKISVHVLPHNSVHAHPLLTSVRKIIIITIQLFKEDIPIIFSIRNDYIKLFQIIK